MNVELILAGGVGNRLGANIPKQFIEVCGKPILVYTIEAFERHSDVDAVIVVCVKPFIDYVWELKEKHNLLPFDAFFFNLYKFAVHVLSQTIETS